jgi:hypothetical protein
MYSKQRSVLYDEDDSLDMWMILDPDGDWICDVKGEPAVDALLSHLNR